VDFLRGVLFFYKSSFSHRGNFFFKRHIFEYHFTLDFQMLLIEKNYIFDILSSKTKLFQNKKLLKMKKRTFFLSVFIMLFFVKFNFAQSDDLSVIELSINNKDFTKYIAKDEMTKPIPLVVVTNHHFSEYVQLDFDGKKIPVFSTIDEASLDADQIFIDIKKFKIRDNTAILKFKYAGYTFKIKHKKKDGIWKYSNFSLKGNKKRYFYSLPVN